MSVVVNMHEAKTNLSKLVKLAEAGEEVVIARDGKPVARLCRPAPAAKKDLPWNLFKGSVRMLENFDDPIEEFE